MCVRQELRVVQQLRGARQIEHEPVRREGHQLLIGLVVLEVVVIVLQEEDRRRPHHRPVQLRDLRPDRFLQNLLVGRTQHALGAIEDARIGLCGRRRTEQIGTLRPQVPIDVVAVRDDRIGGKRHRALEHAPPDRQREESVRADIGRPVVGQDVVTARTGIDQQPDALRAVAGRRERGQLPRSAERTSSRLEDLQRVRAARLEAGRVERPEESERVARAPWNFSGAGKQNRRCLMRSPERCFDQEPFVGCRRQQMHDIAAVPRLAGRTLGSRHLLRYGGGRQRRSADEKVASRRHHFIGQRAESVLAVFRYSSIRATTVGLFAATSRCSPGSAARL